MRIMPSLAARIAVLLAATTCLSAQPLRGQTFDDIGERAQGMGGAFVAVADDASAVYWNPAGLAWPTGSTFDAQLGVGEDATFVGVALPMLGFSYYRLPIVSNPANRQNEGSGKVQIRPLRTSNFGVTLNQTVVNGLVIGTTLRIVRGAVEGAPGSTSFDADAGAMFSVGDVRVGLIGRNLRRPSFSGGDGSDVEVSRQVRAGVAFAPRSLPTGVHGPFTVSADADLARTWAGGREVREAAFGGEYWVGAGLLGARAGLRWSTLGPADARFSAGFTVRLPHSLFVEGHLTERNDIDDARWGLGARITF